MSQPCDEDIEDWMPCEGQLESLMHLDPELGILYDTLAAALYSDEKAADAAKRLMKEMNIGKGKGKRSMNKRFFAELMKSITGMVSMFG